jgi:hypothetical protein
MVHISGSRLTTGECLVFNGNAAAVLLLVGYYVIISNSNTLGK